MYLESVCQLPILDLCLCVRGACVSMCWTEPECSWRERRIKVQLDADASVQAGDDVTLKENAVYSVLDTSSSAAVAADTGVDIDPV